VALAASAELAAVMVPALAEPVELELLAVLVELRVQVAPVPPEVPAALRAKFKSTALLVRSR